MAARPITAELSQDAAAISSSLSAPDAFAAIFNRHFTPIHRYLARRVGRECADDLAAQTFTVAFERRGSFNLTADDARPWLYGIATKLLANHRRREQRQLQTIARLGAQPTEASDAVESDWELASVLASLAPAQLDLLLLHAWAELSYEQIAESLGIPVGTVRSRLARVRAFLRAELASAAPADVPTTQEAS